MYKGKPRNYSKYYKRHFTRRRVYLIHKMVDNNGRIIYVKWPLVELYCQNIMKMYKMTLTPPDKNLRKLLPNQIHNICFAKIHNSLFKNHSKKQSRCLLEVRAFCVCSYYVRKPAYICLLPLCLRLCSRFSI